VDFYLPTCDREPYVIQNPGSLRTPRLVVFHQRLLYNLQTMKGLMSQGASSLSLTSLCPHVKTHKSPYVTRLMMEQDIHFFKATPNEVEMLAAAGAPEVLVAYPLLAADAAVQIDVMMRHPASRFFMQISQPEHARILQQAAEAADMHVSCFIDLDVGMARTGTAPQKALDLYRKLPQFPRLIFAGLHAYDGHIHQLSAEERQLQAGISMDRLQTALDQFCAAGVSIERVVVGGTPSFVHDLQVLGRKQWPFQLYFSPGTWIYFDTHYQRLMPGTFKPAALILCQIMDQTGENRYVLNMGHKRWAVDQGPVEAFSIPGMKALSWSEEHTVVQAPGYCRIGDYVLVAPRHVCSTVNLWEYFALIDERGEVEIAASTIEGRNR